MGARKQEEQGETGQLMINAIVDWGQDKSWFDMTFINSLDLQLKRKGSLTDNQLLALDNIIDKFEIDF